jgi:Calpain family cysteine protease
MIGLVNTWYRRKRTPAASIRRNARRIPLNVELLERRENPSTVLNNTTLLMPFPPAAPSFSASPISASQVSLAWGAASRASGYTVYEWMGGTWSPIAYLGSASTSYVVGNLATNTTYYFDLAATNAFGTTWAANWQSATTYIGAPGAMTFSATTYSYSRINLSWNSVGGATGYLVDQWNGSSWVQIANLGAGSTGFAVTGLASNSTYYFDVAAYNAYGTTWAVNWQSAVTGIWVDHPTAATAYTPVYGSLFGAGGPSYLDVHQGAVGDCWLLASMAEVAARKPADIQNMFSYAGTTVENGSTVSLYYVRFFDSSGYAHWFLVDTELPSGGGYYDHPANGVLWVTLAEKAYAQANAAGVVTTGHEYSDSYAALDEGYATWGLQAITGYSANEYYTNTSDIVNAWNAGEMVVLCTDSPSSSYIVPSHCYALVAYNGSGGLPFEIYNPWGTDSNGWALGTYNGQAVYGLFNANAAFVSQNFAYEAFGWGAAPGMDKGGAVSSFNVVAMNGQGKNVPSTVTPVNPMLGGLNNSPVMGGPRLVSGDGLQNMFSMMGNGGQGSLDALWAKGDLGDFPAGFLGGK